jgi:hypothetical protein
MVHEQGSEQAGQINNGIAEGARRQAGTEVSVKVNSVI